MPLQPLCFMKQLLKSQTLPHEGVLRVIPFWQANSLAFHSHPLNMFPVVSVCNVQLAAIYIKKPLRVCSWSLFPVHENTVFIVQSQWKSFFQDVEYGNHFILQISHCKVFHIISSSVGPSESYSVLPIPHCHVKKAEFTPRRGRLEIPAFIILVFNDMHRETGWHLYSLRTEMEQRYYGKPSQTSCFDIFHFWQGWALY